MVSTRWSQIALHIGNPTCCALSPTVIEGDRCKWVQFRNLQQWVATRLSLLFWLSRFLSSDTFQRTRVCVDLLSFLCSKEATQIRFVRSSVGQWNWHSGTEALWTAVSSCTQVCVLGKATCGFVVFFAAAKFHRSFIWFLRTRFRGLETVCVGAVGEKEQQQRKRGCGKTCRQF